MSRQLNPPNEMVVEKLGSAIAGISEALRLSDWSQPVKEAPDYANDESMSLPRRGKSNLLLGEVVDELKGLASDLSEELD